MPVTQLGTGPSAKPQYTCKQPGNVQLPSPAMLLSILLLQSCVLGEERVEGDMTLAPHRAGPVSVTPVHRWVCWLQDHNKGRINVNTHTLLHISYWNSCCSSCTHLFGWRTPPPQTNACACVLRKLLVAKPHLALA